MIDPDELRRKGYVEVSHNRWAKPVEGSKRALKATSGEEATRPTPPVDASRDSQRKESEGYQQRVEFLIPGQPVPKGRPRVGAGHTFTPERTKRYEKRVRAAAEVAMIGKQRFEFGVILSVEVYIKPFKNGNIPRMDWDNIAKAISDALNGVVYLDDSQIVAAHIRKFTLPDPGVFVIVTGKVLT